eukprot:TRINITY_DN18833_c0_g1_i2.p1 TRINITY_DN18833_c0_g1~~TRINITY_DN18833_c0_g1_i2.p1  ORF type:complete len:393 (-),score=80.78 TRINITY_DN18833_c0_g1_i2:77-1255(-)
MASSSALCSATVATNTLREAGGNLYISFQYVYKRQLPLESIIAAGREVLQKFRNLQPQPSESGEVPDAFSVKDAASIDGVPRVVDPARPFWAVLMKGEETSTIIVTVSHQEADACSLGMFVQAWASQYAKKEWPEPVYDYSPVETLLDANASSEIPEHAGFMSAADLKPDGPPTLGVGVLVDLGRDRLEPLRKALSAKADDTEVFSLNTLRMAIVWKAFVEARKLEKDETTSLCWAVNVRGRVPVPNEYFGNAAITSSRVPLRAEDVAGMRLGELAGLLHKAVRESVTSESILSVLSNIKASIAVNGPVVPSQRRSFWGPKQSILLYSDWSSFDLNPAFDGGKADEVYSMFSEGKPCPIGICANNPEGVYIGMKADEVDDFKLVASKLLTVS